MKILLSSLDKIVLDQNPSILVMVMSITTIISLSYLGISEIMGNHLQYSKFWNVYSGKKQGQGQRGIKLSSRTGMLLLYTPAFLAGLSSFFIYPGGGIRFIMLKSAVTLHFLKRDLEVLFVHKYSGGMILDTVILVSSFYCFAAASMIHFQHLSLGFPEPLIDLKYLGLVIFLVGIVGNFYHHILLSRLRDNKDEKGYKIPKGGLFHLVICPHYLFEIIVFLGLALISQTTFSFACAIGDIMYLVGRSYATRKWYVTKFENFSKDVKALIPYIF